MLAAEFGALRRFVETAFGRIAYVEAGVGPAAIFLHAAPLNGFQYRHLIGELAGMRRCLVIDQMGLGHTEVAPGQSVAFDAQAAMVLALLEVLGLERVDIVAGDSGGAIAQIFAARHPGRVRTLTLTNSDVHDNTPPPAFQPFMDLCKRDGLESVLRRAVADLEFARSPLFFGLGYEHPEELTADTVAAYLGPVLATPDKTRQLASYMFRNNTEHTMAVEVQLRRLRVPTLVVWGLADPFFPPQWAHWLRTTIPGVRRLVELPSARLFLAEERAGELGEHIREHWAHVTDS
jgi:pimeloyl-ACP methyl ester carboxylesterase